MLTTVILEGPMGLQFGREWELFVRSPRDALRLINANAPGVFHWIRNNLEKFECYKVLCERQDGQVEEFDKVDYESLSGEYSRITFVPMVAGAGAAARIVLGVALIALAVTNPAFLGMSPAFSSAVFGLGASMALGGVVQLLTPTAKAASNATDQNKTSYYFNGPVNTVAQGVPVQLIYGRVLVGSHVISAALSVSQVMA